jgi:hypothetical protein
MELTSQMPSSTSLRPSFWPNCDLILHNLPLLFGVLARHDDRKETHGSGRPETADVK